MWTMCVAMGEHEAVMQLYISKGNFCLYSLIYPRYISIILLRVNPIETTTSGGSSSSVCYLLMRYFVCFVHVANSVTLAHAQRVTYGVCVSVKFSKCTR